MNDLELFGIVFAILAFIFLMIYRKTKIKYKLLYIYLIILLVDLTAALILKNLPSHFEWITFSIFIILMFLILFNKFTLKIIKTNVDQIFVDKEPQIWDDFDTPPELVVQNNAK